MSMLVNYVQPVHFHSFEVSESKYIRCWIFCSIKICCPKVGKIIELCLSFVSTWLIIPSISERNKSFEISSFVETQATSLLKEYPVEFVKYPCVYTGTSIQYGQSLNSYTRLLIDCQFLSGTQIFFAVNGAFSLLTYLSSMCPVGCMRW